MRIIGEHFRRYAHALIFAIGLHGAQKFYPIVKYKHYQISSGARASLINYNNHNHIMINYDNDNLNLRISTRLHYSNIQGRKCNPCSNMGSGSGSGYNTQEGSHG